MRVYAGVRWLIDPFLKRIYFIIALPEKTL